MITLFNKYLILKIALLINVKIISKYKISLGLESFDVLGFKSEEELNHEISKLIKVRSEFESKSEVNSF